MAEQAPTVRQMTETILGHEGGFVNDPDDPGGATKWGVTIGTMRRLGVDVDGDGDVDTSDVKLLTKERAIKIYEAEYFEKPRLHQMPESLQPAMYDMAINSGPARAVMILQDTINKAGLARLRVDGGVGPMTIKAANHACEQMGPDALRNAYGIERRNFYYRLARQKPRLMKYARRRDGGKGGWIKRAELFMDERFHLTQVQHDAECGR